MPKHLSWYKDQVKKQKYRNEQRKRNYQNGNFRKDDEKKFWTKEEVLYCMNWKGTRRELAKVLETSVAAITKQVWKYKRSV